MAGVYILKVNIAFLRRGYAKSHCAWECTAFIYKRLSYIRIGGAMGGKASYGIQAR